MTANHRRVQQPTAPKAEASDRDDHIMASPGQMAHPLPPLGAKHFHGGWPSLISCPKEVKQAQKCSPWPQMLRLAPAASTFEEGNAAYI